MTKAKPATTAENNTAEPVKKKGKRRPLGLYLRNDVLAAVQQIAESNGQTVHGIVTYAVSYFVKEHRAKRVIIKTETKQKLKLDL